MAGDPEGDGAGAGAEVVGGGWGDGVGSEGLAVGVTPAAGVGLDVGDGEPGDGAAGLVQESPGSGEAGPAGRACGDAEPGIPPGDPPAAIAWAGDRSWSRGMCSTWMETAETARNAIAPADSTMTGTVLPAGWERMSVPTCPTVVLIRSAASASASCAAGSGGQ